MRNLEDASHPLVHMATRLQHKEGDSRRAFSVESKKLQGKNMYKTKADQQAGCSQVAAHSAFLSGTCVYGCPESVGLWSSIYAALAACGSRIS